MSPAYMQEKYLLVGNSDSFLNDWCKSMGFLIIKDRVVRKEGFIRRRTYICEHGKQWISKSQKDTSSKKISCSWRLNAFCLKENNTNFSIFINKVVTMN